MRYKLTWNSFGLVLVIYACACVLALPAVYGAAAPGSTESLEQLYEKAKKEGTSRECPPRGGIYAHDRRP
jgi:hypothetical protein